MCWDDRVISGLARLHYLLVVRSPLAHRQLVDHDCLIINMFESSRHCIVLVVLPDL